MPDILLHLIVPLAALLLFYRGEYRKYVLLLCPLAFLPDIDHLGSGDVARMWLHNVFILLPPLFIGVYAYRTGHSKAYNIALIALVYLCSHVLLDVFQGGVSLLYPIVGDSYAITCDVLMVNRTLATNMSFTASVPSRDPSVENDVISSVAVAIAILFLLIATLREVLTRRR